MSPWARRGLWGALLLAAGAVRLHRSTVLRPNPALERQLLRTPFDHPPLLDLVTLVLGPQRRLWVAVLAGVLAVGVVGLLTKRALGDGAALLAMAAAVIAPPMVFLGCWWSHESLAVLIAAGTSLLLIHILDDGPTPMRLAGLAAAGVLLTSSSWVGLAPLLAWTAWLAVFAPWWSEPARARAAAGALGLAVLVTMLGVIAMMMTGSDPQGALGFARLPTGLAALTMHVDSIATLLLGRVGRYPVVVRVALAAITAGIVVLGWKRTAPRAQGQSSWASVLLVGTAGGVAVALFVHPWIPIAVEKALWYATPMLLCLALAALWPRSAPLQRLAPLLLVGLITGCTDADDDGYSVQAGDCNDEAATVYPGAPEIWGDGVDNDCDEVVDDSDAYLYFVDEEPNDTLLGGCFAPDGQDLGVIAGFGLLNQVAGVMSSVVDDSYDEGDRDCFQLRLPDDAGHPRLEVRLAWENPESDLDFAVQGLWEGEQSGFALADQPGAGPEFAVTSSGFDGGEALWVWVIGYSGPPTDYTLDLVLR